jgi:hypothetical protein
MERRGRRQHGHPRNQIERNHTRYATVFNGHFGSAETCPKKQTMMPAAR